MQVALHPVGSLGRLGQTRARHGQRIFSIMSILELQITNAKFLAAIRAEVLRTQAIYLAIRDGFSAFGALLPEDLRHSVAPIFERFESVEVQFSPASTPGLRRLILPHEQLVKVDLGLRVTTLVALRARGSLAAPTQAEVNANAPLSRSLYVALRVLRVDMGIQYEVVGGDEEISVSGVFQTGFSPPIATDYPGAVIFERDGVTCLRLSTVKEHTDNPGALVAVSRGNRLNGSDWGFFLDGQLVADDMASKLNATVKAVAQASSNPEIEITSEATGQWSTPSVSATTKLNAVDALPAGFDAPLRIDLSTEILAQNQQGRALMTLNTRVQWIAEDLLTDLGLDTAQDTINDALAAGLSRMTGSQRKTGSGADFVQYQVVVPLTAPRSQALVAAITQVAMDVAGVAIRGTLTARPDPLFSWSFVPPTWGFHGDCSSKSVGLKLSSPKVVITGVNDANGTILPMGETIAAPPRAWLPDMSFSALGISPTVFEVEFEPSFQLKSDLELGTPGLTGSAFIFTSVGARWVDFGLLPSRPLVDEHELLSRTVRLISNCMAISDRWGMGVLNLDWLSDPPHLDIRTAFPMLRQWRIVGNGVHGVETIEVFAHRSNGGHRPLEPAKVDGGLLVYEAVTHADELLELRTGRRMEGAPPHIVHRWLAPSAILPLDAYATIERHTHSTPSLPARTGHYWAPQLGYLSRVVALHEDAVIVATGGRYESYVAGIQSSR